MFDPGAMGTLMIGLNAVREESLDNHLGRPRAASRRDVPGIRIAMARGLRRAAEMLERPTLREAA
jgi:hypothetical protein